MITTNGRNLQPEEERLSIFELSGKLFGLEITRSREVIPLPRFTALPNSGNIFLGVFNLRGEIYPLVDLSPVLGLSKKQIQSDDMAVLIDDNDSMVVAMLVDKIDSVCSYAASDIKPARGTVARKIESFVSGVLEHNNNLIHILDLDSVFKNQDLLAHY